MDPWYGVDFFLTHRARAFPILGSVILAITGAEALFLALRWFLYPLIGIATRAPAVASQALISGAFSLTQQAVQLGYVPRVTIVHPSAREPGQIDVPEVNAALMVGCLVLVVTFRSSSRSTFGFMERPDVPAVLARARSAGVRAAPAETSYFLGRERLLPTGGSKMVRWRKKLFVLMSRNAQSAAEFFALPPNRVVELGAQIEF